MSLLKLTMTEEQRAQGAVLFDDGQHRYYWLGLVEEEGGESVQVNQYAIEHGGRVAILDPGGVLTFPHVVAALSRFVSLDAIETLFYSHQDPDVCSGIALWLQATQAQAYISQHWLRFVPHFGELDMARLTGIPDEGQTLRLGLGASLRLVPAHFLHSVGNFCVYDPRSKILFSGDIGASVFLKERAYAITDDFPSHRSRMEGFHKRYMASNAACRQWVSVVRTLDVELIAPQHGAMLRGRAVHDFLDWLERLECGVDRIAEIYGGHRG